jgi:atypical dual specificity phosphatase
VFLLTLHQKLDGLLRVLLNITNKTSGDTDREDLVIPESPSHGVVHYPSPPSKERFLNDNHSDFSDSDSQRMAQTPRSSLGSKENSDSSSPMSKESWHGKLSKGSGEPLRSLCLTTKLREILKFAKVRMSINMDLEIICLLDIDHWLQCLKMAIKSPTSQEAKTWFQKCILFFLLALIVLYLTCFHN